MNQMSLRDREARQHRDCRGGVRAYRAGLRGNHGFSGDLGYNGGVRPRRDVVEAGTALLVLDTYSERVAYEKLSDERSIKISEEERGRLGESTGARESRDEDKEQGDPDGAAPGRDGERTETRQHRERHW